MPVRFCGGLDNTKIEKNAVMGLKKVHVTIPGYLPSEKKKFLHSKVKKPMR